MRQKTNSPLRNVRRSRTITQSDLARLVGVTQETVSKYESGRVVPPPDVQMRIAAILGAPVDALFPAYDEARAS